MPMYNFNNLKPYPHQQTFLVYYIVTSHKPCLSGVQQLATITSDFI